VNEEGHGTAGNAVRGGMRGRVCGLGGRLPRFERPDSVWIAPGATLIGNLHLAVGVSVWFGAVVRADNEPMRIGAFANIQDGCVLHSDPGFPLTVEDWVTVGHRAVLHGCRIGEGALVGMGATVMNGADIGPECIVGAGALVPEGMRAPRGSLLLGMPARAVRDLTAAERRAGRASAEAYAQRAAEYAAGFHADDGFDDSLD